jgi:hypothetical protein
MNDLTLRENLEQVRAGIWRVLAEGGLLRDQSEALRDALHYAEAAVKLEEARALSRARAE